MLPVAVQLPVLGLYNSALAIMLFGALSPPATRTVPFGSSVAVWAHRAVPMLPVAVQVPGWDTTIVATGVSAPDLFKAAKARTRATAQRAKPNTRRSTRNADRESDFVFIEIVCHSFQKKKPAGIAKKLRTRPTTARAESDPGGCGQIGIRSGHGKARSVDQWQNLDRNLSGKGILRFDRASEEEAIRKLDAR